MWLLPAFDIRFRAPLHDTLRSEKTHVMAAPSSTRPGRWLWLATAGPRRTGFVALGARPLHAQERGGTGPRLKTESPYFFVKSDDPTTACRSRAPKWT